MTSDLSDRRHNETAIVFDVKTREDVVFFPPRQSLRMFSVSPAVIPKLSIETVKIASSQHRGVRSLCSASFTSSIEISVQI